TVILMQEGFNVVSFSLYHKLGFGVRSVFLAIKGDPPRVNLDTGKGTRLRPIAPEDLDEIAALDEKLTGLARRADFEFVLRYGRGVLALDGAKMRGFGFALGNESGWNVGPVITYDEETAETLIYAVRGDKAGSMFIRVDARHPALLNRLYRHGFVLDTISTLMVRGPYRPPDAVALPSLFPEVLA
ncbi:MAG: hypothetical protein ACREDF_06290, partial [Thermoplasmata archaeon]